MQVHGVGEKVLAGKKSSAYFEVAGNVSCCFKVKNSLRLVRKMSPWLFIIHMDVTV